MDRDVQPTHVLQLRISGPSVRQSLREVIEGTFTSAFIMVTSFDLILSVEHSECWPFCLKVSGWYSSLCAILTAWVSLMQKEN